MRPVRLLVPLALLVLSAPALAQLTEKQAVAEVKAAGKSALSEFKQLGKASLASLDAELKVIEAGLDDTTTVATFSSGVSNALIEFLGTLDDAWETSLLGFGLATTTAMAQLDGGGADGVYPESVYAGAGGVVDAFRKSLLKAAHKVRDAAIKRLAKCAAKAEKAGLALTVRLELPATAVAYFANPGASGPLNEDARIDLALAVSALDTLVDGSLVVSGTTGLAEDVTVTWARSFAEEDSVSVEPEVSGRFLASFTALKEGSYAVGAVQGTGLLDAVADIGVR
jgi:hypothetical protein